MGAWGVGVLEWVDGRGWGGGLISSHNPSLHLPNTPTLLYGSFVKAVPAAALAGTEIHSPPPKGFQDTAPDTF